MMSSRRPRSTVLCRLVFCFILMLGTIGVNAALTRQECMEQGGVVVGDIGDGATQRSDYICESSGEPIVDVIVPAPDESIATEGEVCCASSATADGSPSSSRPSVGGETTSQSVLFWKVLGLGLFVATFLF